MENLNKNRLVKVARYIETKSRWIEGTEPFAVVANVDVCDTYVYVNILTSDAMVRAKSVNEAGLWPPVRNGRKLHGLLRGIIC